MQASACRSHFLLVSFFFLNASLPTKHAKNTQSNRSEKGNGGVESPLVLQTFLLSSVMVPRMQMARSASLCLFWDIVQYSACIPAVFCTSNLK